MLIMTFIIALFLDDAYLSKHPPVCNSRDCPDPHSGLRFSKQPFLSTSSSP
jgi:hypothetical protein